MADELLNFTKTVENFGQISLSEKIDFFAFYYTVVEKQNYFSPILIAKAFNELRLVPYTNISQYLTDNSNKALKRKKTIKYLKTKIGYHLESSFQFELQSKITNIEDIPFLNYSLNQESLNWKPNDVPLINNKIKHNAEFFTKIYHLLYYLENSIRKFLMLRLSSIYGNNWANKLLTTIDLSKALAIRSEVDLTEMISHRGDNILYYCMWDDYGKILQSIPSIINNKKDSDELVAHLNTLSKIRNAVAHNADTFSSDYKDELTLFLKKYIRIIGKQVNK